MTLISGFTIPQITSFQTTMYGSSGEMVISYNCFATASNTCYTGFDSHNGGAHDSGLSAGVWASVFVGLGIITSTIF